MKLTYMQRIKLSAQFFGENPPQGLLNVTVTHQNNCEINDDKPCSCIPDIEVEADGRRFIIDDEGVMHEQTAGK